MPPRDPKIEFKAELLRTLHHLHRQQADLQNQVERGPRQISASEALIQKSAADLEAAKGALKTARAASDERQLQLKWREDRIEDLKKKLNTAASNREFDTLKEQIAADQQANEVLSDEILEGLEKLDLLEQQVRDAEANQKKITSEQRARIEEIEKRLVTVREDLAGVQAAREQAESNIPTAAKNAYLRITSAKGEDALAPVDNQSCGGCFQTLTTQMMNRLHLSEMVHCPNCNAFLYLPEDAKVI